MSALAAIEDALLAACRDTLGQHVRAVESHPGTWTDDELKRRLRQAPGVFVAFDGASRGADVADVTLRTRWPLYVLTADVGAESARRRGRGEQMGAWDILEAVLPAVHGLAVPGVGTVELGEVRNLYSGTLDRDGLALYVAVLTVPVALSQPLPDGLADFATFDAQYDIDPMEGTAEHTKWLDEPPDHTTSAPDAHDIVTDLDT